MQSKQSLGKGQYRKVKRKGAKKGSSLRKAISYRGGIRR